MSKKTKRAVKTMVDASGNIVPMQYVDKYDKARDRAVLRILTRWQKVRALLEKTMADTLREVEQLRDLRTKETGVEPADRGNYRVSSFDGNTAVELRQTYRIYLDDRVTEARRIMLEWAAGLTDDIENIEKRDFMMQLVEEAFSANTADRCLWVRYSHCCAAILRTRCGRRRVSY